MSDLRKEPRPEIMDFYRRSRAVGVRIGPLMAAAKMHPSTWSRWMNGKQPTLESLERVDAALKEMGG